MEVKGRKEYDEKSMIIEQDRQARERKKRKNRARKRIAGGLVFFLAAGGIWYLGWGRNISARADSNSAVNIVADKGQEILYARLDKVYGNEVTYTVTEEVSAGTGAVTIEGAVPGMDAEAGNMQSSPDMDSTGHQSRMEKGGSGARPEENVNFDSSDLNTAFIPVGTPVITKLGAETTFSRLASGDQVAFVVEKADGETVIQAVYIIG